MYYPGFYQELDEHSIAEDIRQEGFDPIRVVDPPGTVYATHEHPETKLLAFLQGTMDVTVGAKRYHCQPGDKLLIPGKTPHAAVVGNEGCVFFWSERLLSENP